MNTYMCMSCGEVFELPQEMTKLRTFHRLSALFHDVMCELCWTEAFNITFWDEICDDGELCDWDEAMMIKYGRWDIKEHYGEY